jgi:uncharacterized membrane protein
VRFIALVAVAVAALAISACGGSDNGASSSEPATLAEVEEIFEHRCVPCHSMNPTMEGVFAAPASLELDRRENITTLKDLIYERVVVKKDMPDQNQAGEPNATGMTDEERERFASWYRAGAKE